MLYKVALGACGTLRRQSVGSWVIAPRVRREWEGDNESTCGEVNHVVCVVETMEIATVLKMKP